MASIILAAAGTAIGGSIGGAVLGVCAATIGGAVGSIAGAAIDSWLVASMAPTQKIAGQRLDTLQITASTEGAVIPRVYGRMRIGRQHHLGDRLPRGDRDHPPGRRRQGRRRWRRHRGHRVLLLRQLRGRALRGPDHRHRAHLGRRQADEPRRRHHARRISAARTRTPIRFIAAKMGAANTPAYRGTAYVVFEELPLERFGNRLPQLSFEVFRPILDGESAESLVRAVTLIPASGEFAYATDVVRREIGDSTSPGERQRRGACRRHRGRARPAAGLRAERRVGLARRRLVRRRPARRALPHPAGRRGRARRPTTPENWSVNGVSRGSAHLVSRDAQDRPAYGGTPSDIAVVQAIQELKARGYRVTFYPFILMDVPADNDLPDPYSDDAAATGQPAYPWRGRITCSPAAGYAGSVDKTAAAGTQVAAFFGDAAAVRLRRRRRERQLGRRSGRLGPAADDPALRASLRRGRRGRCLPDRLGAARAHAGAERRVELPGGRRARRPRRRRAVDPRGGHRAQLRRRLVGVFRASPAGRLGRRLLPPRPALGRRRHRLRRHRQLHAARPTGATGSTISTPRAADAITDLDYLRGNIEGGEGFDWFYASDADREAQVRTPITDGAARQAVGLPLQGPARAGGRTSTATARAASRAARRRPGSRESKPIRFTEIGCPAVDRGPNQPNVFYDPKSAESFLPYFSRGWRDDAIQRRFLEAVLGLLGRAGQQPDVGRLLGADDHHRRDRAPGPGTRGPIRPSRRGATSGPTPTTGGSATG